MAGDAGFIVLMNTEYGFPIQSSANLYMKNDQACGSTVHSARASIEQLIRQQK